MIFQEQFRDCWSFIFGAIVQLNLKFEVWYEQEGEYRHKQVRSFGERGFGKMSTFVWLKKISSSSRP